MGVKLGHKGEYRLKVSENKVLRRISGPKTGEMMITA
jgi:hypothetical protein